MHGMTMNYFTVYYSSTMACFVVWERGADGHAETKKKLDLLSCSCHFMIYLAHTHCNSEGQLCLTT